MAKEPEGKARRSAELVSVIGLRRGAKGYRVVRGQVGLDLLELDDVTEQPLEYATARLLLKTRELVHRAGTRR